MVCLAICTCTLPRCGQCAMRQQGLSPAMMREPAALYAPPSPPRPPLCIQSFLPDAASDEERFLSVFVAGSVASKVEEEVRGLGWCCCFYTTCAHA